VERQWGILKELFGDASLVSTMGGQKATVEGVIRALLQMAVSDPDVSVRRTIMEHVQALFAANTGRMETFFAQADAMRVLRICMNDECIAVRNGAITLMGQLSVYNPACVNPTLRRHLHQVRCGLRATYAREQGRARRCTRVDTRVDTHESV